MSKTILLIICDFLILSILALVDFDEPVESAVDPARQQAAEFEQGAREDMVELLRLSLEEEAQQRAALNEELAEREAALAEREAALSETSENLGRSEEKLARIRQEREALAAEREQLQAEYQAARSTIEQGESERARIAAELESQQQQAQQLQSELQARQEALAEAAQNLSRREEELAQLEQARSELETNLQITQTERAMLEENLTAARAQVETARVERRQAEQRAEQLAANVGTLAERSTAIEEEIRRSQPISLNRIFSRYENNRLPLHFTARIDLLLGSRVETSSVDAILVEQNNRFFALFESGLSPFRVESLDRLSGASASFQLAGQNFEVVEVSFLQADPRIVAVQIPTRFVESSDLTPFRLADEPLRFPEVVLVSNQLGEYGETSFKLMPGGQRYLSVPNRLLGRVFGNDFGASRGDYIFAKTGDLLGLMISNDRGAILADLRSIAELPLGDSFDAQLADRLHRRLNRQLPPAN